MTRIETFAEHHRLKVTRDECNDQVIQGRRGQLYFDGAELCLMVLDGEPAIRSKWKELGGNLWMGDISPHPNTGKRVQDVKTTCIPLENARLAIRMCRIKAKRIMSEAQKAVLDRARSLLPSPPQRQRHSIEPPADPGVMVRGGEAPETKKGLCRCVPPWEPSKTEADAHAARSTPLNFSGSEPKARLSPK